MKSLEVEEANTLLKSILMYMIINDGEDDEEDLKKNENDLSGLRRLNQSIPQSLVAQPVNPTPGTSQDPDTKIQKLKAQIIKKEWSAIFINKSWKIGKEFRNEHPKYFQKFKNRGLKKI